MPTSQEAVDGPVEFTCPRCGTEASGVFWGPCGRCRTELRASVVGRARRIETAAYEPKMNVTPNAVATKD